MISLSCSLRLRDQTARAALEMAEALDSPGHCALLFWGSYAEVEVVSRAGLSLELCAALSSEGGKSLLAWACRSPAPQRVVRDSLGDVAPELAETLLAEGVESLAVIPLLGDRGVVGFVVLDLPGTWDEEAFGSPARLAQIESGSRVPERLQLAAGNAALKTILKVREKEPPGGVDGILVLDEDRRVLFAQGLLQEVPEWGTDDVYGRTIKSLPGGKILAAIGVDSPSRLLWKERTLPSAGTEGIPAGIAAVALSSSPPGPHAARIYVMRDLREGGARASRPEGAFLLELAMRISHLAHQLRQGEGDSGPESGEPSRTHRGDSGPVGIEEDGVEGGELSGVWLEGELEESEVLLASAMRLADTDRSHAAVDVADLLTELQDEHGPELLEERIQILPILSSDLPSVSGDPRKLKTAFRVLMLTSRRSLRPAGGTIFFRAWEDDGNVFCTVSDDGPGMEEREVDELMALEPLFDDGELPSPEQSFGMVKVVVEELGGRLHIESRPQLWTRFTVMIPACRAPAGEARDVRESLPPAVEVRSTEPGALEVLVVDDNDSIRGILRRCLEKRGHQVTEAGDGKEALDLVRGREFDRLMVDIYMPGITGTEFFDGLDRVAPILKDRTIFMTGGLQDTSLEDYVESTGRPSIQKPFDLLEMVRTLEG